MRREVRRAFEQAPESHRSESFKKDFQATRQILCELVRAQNVELFMGSGTLANDVVAGQLSLLERPRLGFEQRRIRRPAGGSGPPVQSGI